MPTSEPVTITFVCAEEQEAYYKPLVEAFHKKDRYINIQFVRPLMYELADADVFTVSPFLRQFIQGDFETLDLSSWIAGEKSFDRDDFYPSTIELFTEEDEEENKTIIWAIPYLLDVTVMYYNRDLFDQYGVAYPQLEWTWEDFQRIGQALYDPADGVFAYAPDTSFNDPLNFIYQNGGTIFDDLFNPTRTTFNDARTVEALDWYAKLMYENKAAASPHDARKAYSVAGYIQSGLETGRLGMWTGGISERGRWFDKESWTFKWGIVPLPRGVQSATLASVDGLAIAADAANPEACWKWVSFLTRQASSLSIPPRKSLVASEAYQDQVGKEVATAVRMSAEHMLMFSPKIYEFYDGLRLYNEAVGAVLEGATTASEALNQAQIKSRFK